MQADNTLQKDNNSKSSVAPTLLLVEDDLTLSQMYQRKFELEGFKVLHAPNGEAGIRLALEENVGLILLDIGLPRVSGIDFLETLRQSKKGKDIPIIALTNFAEDERKEKALDLGVKEYLVKAMQTPEDVVEIVKKYIK